MADKPTVKPSPVVALAKVGIVAIGLMFVWKGAHLLDETIAHAPVYGAKTVEEIKKPDVKPEALKSLYPLLVESAGRQALQEREDVGLLWDAAFAVKPPVSATSTVSAPSGAPSDIFPMLKDHLVLDALINKEGAIINGKLYGPGEPLSGYAYPDLKGKSQTPYVLSIGATWVDIAEPETGRRVRLTSKDIAGHK